MQLMEKRDVIGFAIRMWYSWWKSECLGIVHNNETITLLISSVMQFIVGVVVPTGIKERQARFVASENGSASRLSGSKIVRTIDTSFH